MKQFMTREQVFELWYVLKHCIPEGTKLDKRFDFARNRTIDNLTPEVTEIIKARESGIERYNEFESKRNELIDKYCLKDENGNFVNSGDKYVFNSLEDEKEAYNKLRDLADEYKDALNERQKEIDIYNEIVKEEIEVDIVKTTFKAIPDLVDEAFTKVLRSMIKETDDEIEAMIME